MLEEILELHKAGRLEDAEGRYRELLAFNPDDPEVLHLLGALRRQRGDVVEAIALVSRAAELAPERANFQTTLGGLLMHVRQWERSRAAFARAVELNPNLTSAYSALAQIAMLLRDHDEAEKHFKLALRAGEERVEVFTGYGNLLLARGKPEAALQYLTRAVELFPQVASAQGSLGRAYLNTGHFAFAERALANAIALDPQFHTGRLLLAEAQFKLKRYDDARATLAPLIDSPRNRGDALAMRGDIARAQDRHDEAIADYRESLAAKPGSAPVVEALTWCLLRGGRRAEAIDVLHAHLTQKPDDAPAQRQLAQLLAQHGDFVRAADALRIALDATPDDTELRDSYAAVLELTGNLEAAEDEADRVLARVPSDPGAAQLKARALLRRGAGQDALAVLAKADDAALPGPVRRLGFALRGHAHLAAREPEAAVADWIRSQELRGGSTGLPPIPDIPPSFAHQVEDTAARAATNSAIVPAALLLGAPGSGVDLLAALIADSPALHLLADRFSTDARNDPFSTPDVVRMLGRLDDGDARILARHYERPLQRLAPRADAKLVEWLPHWDARYLPMILRIFGRVPVIVATRDPRDALVQWLAFGCPQGLSCADPVGAAAWLESAHAHLRWAREHGEVPMTWIDTSDLAARPEDAGRAVADALGVAPIVPGEHFTRATRILGGLPSRLPAGTWTAFEEALAPAFAKLSGT